MEWWRKERDGAPGTRDVAQQDEELLDAYSHAVISVVEAVSSSVVHVRVRGVRQGQNAQGSGSGTILSPDGLVLTNNHVVEGASAIELALPDGRHVAARLLGRDGDTDIAVLRAETGDGLPAARLGNSKKVRPGQVAVAIGNPFGFESTVPPRLARPVRRPLRPTTARLSRNPTQTHPPTNPG